MEPPKQSMDIKQIFRARIEETFEKLRMPKRQAAAPKNVAVLDLERVKRERDRDGGGRWW